MAGQNLGFDPNRPILAPVSKTGTAHPPVADQHAAAPQLPGDASHVAQSADHSRLEEQKAAFGNMWDSLMADTRLAAIMLNPITGPQAQMLAWSATGRAITRYETEVPQQPYAKLREEEMNKARKEIEALPHTYGQAVSNFGSAIDDEAIKAGQAVSDAGSSAITAVGSGLTEAGNGVSNFFTGVGNSVTGTFHAARHGFASMLRSLAGSLDTTPPDHKK